MEPASRSKFSAVPTGTQETVEALMTQQSNCWATFILPLRGEAIIARRPPIIAAYACQHLHNAGKQGLRRLTLAYASGHHTLRFPNLRDLRNLRLRNRLLTV